MTDEHPASDAGGDDGIGIRRASAGQDAGAFAARLTPFLSKHEAENCFLLGILSGSGLRRSELYFASIEAAGVPVGAAALMPPGGLVIATGTAAAGLSPLADDLSTSGFPVPHVIGPPALAAAFAAAWCDRHGCRARVSMAQRVFRLEAVRRGPRVVGGLRAATVADRDLLIDWLQAFAAEAMGEHDRAAAAEAADAYLAGPPHARAVHVWEDAGRPVSMAGIAGPTPNGIRVNAVYTPPELRGRGYASAAVAAVSQAQLDAGRRFCFLFTDLANPTSNRIYRAIGYEPVADFERHDFFAEESS